MILNSRPQTDKQALMTEFTIQCLKDDLQDKNDLIEIYKVALAEEGQNLQVAKTEARLAALAAIDAISKGHAMMAQAHLQALFNAMA